MVFYTLVLYLYSYAHYLDCGDILWCVVVGNAEEEGVEDEIFYADMNMTAKSGGGGNQLDIIRTRADVERDLHNPGIPFYVQLCVVIMLLFIL